MSDDRLDRMGAFDAVMWGVEQDPVLRSVDRRHDRARPRAGHRPARRPDHADDPGRAEAAPAGHRQSGVADPAALGGRPQLRPHLPPQALPRPRRRHRPPAAAHRRADGRAGLRPGPPALGDGPGPGLGRRSLRRDHQAAPRDHRRGRRDGDGRQPVRPHPRRRRTDLGPMPPEPTADVLGLPGRVVNGAQFAVNAAYRRGRALTGGAIGLVERVVADPGESAVSGAAFAQSAARLLAPANEPLSPLMHGRSLSVQLAVIQVPFRPFKAAAKTVGGTLNDTYMAAVGGGVAAYHEAHNAPCEYVRVNMPVNMRTSSDDSAGQPVGAGAVPDADRQRRCRDPDQASLAAAHAGAHGARTGGQRHDLPAADRPAAERCHLGRGGDDEGLRPGHHQRARSADRAVRLGRARSRRSCRSPPRAGRRPTSA